MENRDPKLTPEGLLQQRAWIRGLAQSLVGDAATADDVVQETYVAALRNPPAGIDQEPVLRAWLARVVKRISMQGRRSEARRSYRQKVAASPDVVPDTTELIVRAELQGRLAQAVVALDEPYRQAVLLRYFEDLSAAEIARRLGLPAATVRSQIKRGLDKLRVELDRKYEGDRSAWAGVLTGFLSKPIAPLPTSPIDPAGLSLIKGVLVMKGTLHVAAIAAFLLTAGVGVWMWQADANVPGSNENERGRAVAEVNSSELELEPAELSASSSERTEERSTALEELPEEEALLPISHELPRGPVIVTARLIDEEGNGLIGATLTKGNSEEVAHSTAGGDVHLEFELEGFYETLEFVSRSEGHADVWSRALVRLRETTHMGDIVLVRAGTVRGKVQDEDGNPIAGAMITSTSLENERRDPEQLRRIGPELGKHAIRTESASDGTFALSEIGSGTVRIWAHFEGYAWSGVGPIEVAPAGTVNEIELVLERLREDDSIEGLVLMPDGSPSVGTRIEYWFQTATIGTGGAQITDEEGRFSILVQHRVPHDLGIVDRKERYNTIRRTVDPGTEDLVFQFEEAQKFEVIATDDENSNPVTTFAVFAENLGDSRDDLVRSWGGERPGGIATIRRPKEPFRVRIEARGYERWRSEQFLKPEEVERVAAALTPLDGIRGRVLVDGEPQGMANVTLHEVVSSSMMHTVNDFRSITGREEDRQSSGKDGSFQLFVERGGQYVLRAEYPGWARTEIGPFEFETDGAYEDLEIELVRGGAIAGKVLTRAGIDPAGIVVGFNRGDGNAQTVRVGPDGLFRLEELTPGPWEVTRREREVLPSEHSASYSSVDNAEDMKFDCVVVDGLTTTFDIDLRDVPPCSVQGKVTAQDVPFEQWTASLAKPGIATMDEVLASTLLAADGSFELELDLPGDYLLLIQAPMGTSGRLELIESLHLEPGPRSWEFTQEFGSVRVAGVPTDMGSEELLEYRWNNPSTTSGVTVKQRCVVDQEGNFNLPFAPAGAGEIWRYIPQGGERRTPWENLNQFEVIASEELQVALP